MRTGEDDDGYAEMMEKMSALGPQQPGFLGLESARDPETRFGITVVYWKTLEGIDQWRNHLEHIDAKKQGREKWYDRYTLRISRVESENTFTREK